LWRASVLDDRLSDATPALADRAMCIAALAIEAQVDADGAAGYPSPGRVEGAWFIDDITRMDDQQHALSGLLLTIPILEAGGMSSATHTAPSALLWLLVAIAIINPLRASLAVPRSGRGRNEIALIGVVGGLAGAALIVAVGATNGWLLDTLDVSRAAMRVAAGGLCALAGIVDIARKPPSAEPSLPGRRAALVPVAIPLFARPAIIVAGLSLVADHGLSLLTLSVAIAIAALGLAAPFVPDDGPMRVVLLWGVRLLAAIAVVGGVLLSADGVLDI
jgi:small neutral amino acid transporter SnatA (MarC family)